MKYAGLVVIFVLTLTIIEEFWEQKIQQYQLLVFLMTLFPTFLLLQTPG